jgi:hypothetical protein
MAIRMGVALIRIALMTGDVEQIFMCTLAICASSLKKCLFKSLPIFKIGL